ncbi:MAG: DUF4230 domain-containing protein [Lachnospiraceae bacterium]|nr:DUF4230 domain-containing protein [Lachnospiraceae bacterium]
MGIFRDYKNRTITGAIAIVIVALFVGTAFFCYTSGVKNAKLVYEATKPKITGAILKQQIMEVKELTTVEYNYTTMGQFENSTDFYGMKVPFTTKKFIVSYDGNIRAGVDLTSIEIDVTETVITVTLPKAEILSHEVDEGSFQIYDEKNGIFNKIKLEDYNRFQIEQKKTMEDKALSSGILTEAYDNAQNIVRNMIQIATNDNEYKVIIKEK